MNRCFRIFTLIPSSQQNISFMKWNECYRAQFLFSGNYSFLIGKCLSLSKKDLGVFKNSCLNFKFKGQRYDQELNLTEIFVLFYFIDVLIASSSFMFYFYDINIS